VVTKDFVHLDLIGGRSALAVSQSGERIWILDDKNGIQSIELGSGEVAGLSALPRSAQISQFIAGRAYLYALDEKNGVLYMVPVSGDAITSVGLRLPKSVTSTAVGAGDRLWLGLSDSSLLVQFDPTATQSLVFDLRGAHVSKLATDALGRVFYADDSRNAVGLLDPESGKTTEAAFPRHGVTTSLVVDASSTMWLGTSAGEIWKVRGGVYTLAAGLQRPVTTIALDGGGRAWYLSPLPAGTFGFGYASADGAGEGRSISGPASSLAFSALGRAWLADPRGGFWVGGGTP
jgi:ligand-binding sensor domain-containing protein